MKLAILAETHLMQSKYITGSTIQQYFSEQRVFKARNRGILFLLSK